MAGSKNGKTNERKTKTMHKDDRTKTMQKYKRIRAEHGFTAVQKVVNTTYGDLYTYMQLLELMCSCFFLFCPLCLKPHTLTSSHVFSCPAWAWAHTRRCKSDRFSALMSLYLSDGLKLWLHLHHMMRCSDHPTRISMRRITMRRFVLFRFVLAQDNHAQDNHAQDNHCTTIAGLVFLGANYKSSILD